MADNPVRRSKSSIARSLLQRVSSKTDVTEDQRKSDAVPSPTSNASFSVPNTSQQPPSNSEESQKPESGAADYTKTAAAQRLVKNLELVTALTSGDTKSLSAFITDRRAQGSDGCTMLHLAVEVADVPTVEEVLKISKGQFINTTDKDGNTPLHLAARRGDPHIVRLLLVQPGLDESKANTETPPKTALDVAGERKYFNEKVFEQLQAARSQRVESVVKIHVEKIRGFIQAGAYDQLGQLLSEPSVKNVLDVNDSALADAKIRATGGSLLHEAARKHDTRLIDTLLMNGADPFRRDGRGHLPRDVTKDPKTRAMLKKSPAAAAAQRGIQEKLILGTSASRNSNGDITLDSKEAREMKGYLKKWTNYTSGYKLRWFVLEDGVLSYYEHQDDAGSACRGAINMRIAKLHMDPKEKRAFDIHGKSSVKYSLKADHEVEAKRWFWALNNAIQFAKDEERQQHARTAQSTEITRSAPMDYLTPTYTRELDETGSSNRTSAIDLAGSVGSVSALGDVDGSMYEPSIVGEDTAQDFGFTDDDASSHDARTSGQNDFNIPAQAACLQLDFLSEFPQALIATFVSEPKVAEALLTVYPSIEEAVSALHPSLEQLVTPFGNAIKTQGHFIEEMRRIHRQMESSWKAQLDSQVRAARWWEENAPRFAKEHEELQRQTEETEDKLRKTKRALREALEAQSLPAGQKPTTPGEAGVEDATANLSLEKEGTGRPRRRTIADLTNNQISDDESDLDDEFFDAVDAGEVPVVEDLPRSETPVQQPNNSVADKQVYMAKEIAKSYKGYENGIRKRLKLDNDNRPKVSLWAVLKSMIGKDMTKMTLPVSFNEPTSLLYRVAEDMEYADLLNTAAERSDPTERMVYVAAFAASEYASTTGRVAKPFNPLLGETYEYVRPDKGYRFFIEQVSHHPPVGAAFAESPKWDYYGESSVKSKFYGKSFEFNPLGTWFLNLRPDTGSPAEELYTWKKVTSSVVGIITGNPQVDNYGPMEIKNHTTGESCILDFKARGWKASSAFIVTGKVLDADGNVKWSIGGRWNDKIYVRSTPGFEGEVEARSDQASLIWEAHPRPNVPFNLTAFAVTLNDDDPQLLRHVAPTDTRLRPDQRCLELGEYDKGASEKTRVEEKQRATRRRREQAGEEFTPRWFVKDKHPVTGEPYWKFGREYWNVRDKVASGERKWEEEQLEDIF